MSEFASSTQAVPEAQARTREELISTQREERGGYPRHSFVAEALVMFKSNPRNDR